MGRVENYVIELLDELQQKRNSITDDKNEYEKVKIRYEILSLEEKLENASNILGTVFNEDQLRSAALGVMSDEEMDAAINELDRKNERSINAYRRTYQGIIDSAKLRKESALRDYPGCDNPNSPDHEHYASIERDVEKAQQALDNPNYKKNSILTTIKPEYFNAYIKKLAEKLDDSGINNEWHLKNQITDYEVVDKSEKGVVYPVREKINQITDDLNLDGYKKTFILNNLPFIDEMTAIDSKDSTNKMYNGYSSNIERVIDGKNRKNFNEAAKEKNLNHILNESDGGFDEVVNQEDLNTIFNDNFNFEYSQDTLFKFTKLLQEMNARNMVPENAHFKEEGVKFYGFTRFAKAREKLIATIQADEFDYDEFTKDLQSLKDEVANIEGAMEEIEEEIGTDFDAMPTNVDTIRNGVIPRRFKQNLPHNAQISGLYITLSFLKSQNISIDDFVHDPTKVLKDAFEKNTKDLLMDNVLKDDSKASALFKLSTTSKEFKSVDVYGYLRAVEFYNAIEKDPEKRKHNNLVLGGLLNQFGKRKGALDLAVGYFAEANKSETLQNIFLAEKDDDGKINYFDCHSTVATNIFNPEMSQEYVKGIPDRKTGLNVTDKPTAIDKISSFYDFQNTYYDIMATIKNFSKMEKDPKNSKLNKQVSARDLVGAAQELCAKYLLTHDIDAMNKEAKALGRDEVISKDFYNQMVNFIKDATTETTLNGINLEGCEKEDLAKDVKNRKSLMSKKLTNMTKPIETTEKEFNQTFKDINKLMDDLDKKVDKIAKKIGQGETNAEIEEIGLQNRRLLNQLMEAQNNRIDQLKDEYENGKISKYYYETRVKQVKNLQDLDKIPPMFEIDEPHMKNYKSYVKHITKTDPESLVGMEEQELKDRFMELKEKLTAEKNAFLADHVLSDKGIKTRKALSSKNEFAVKSDLLQIDEVSYQQEFAELTASNAKLQEERKQIVVEEEDELLKEEQRLNESSQEIIEDKDLEKENSKLLE